ncbi:interferon alpha-1/13-like [Sardina pilchardus]|uniref:interferon alpha-1/13-like n=1 Tax=Sardina pilchardus TaxID=27697 RepID=UPI002E15699C
MAPQTFALLGIILCAAHVYTVPVTCRLQGALIKTVHDLLENMGGRFPLECLDHNVQLTFPASAFNRTAQVNVGMEKATHEVLRHIDIVFENDTMPLIWDQRKLDGFRNIVYRLVEESECVLNKSQPIQEDDFTDRKIALDAYFKDISDNLQQKEFSVCAWEVARKEILRTLGFILRLL